MTTIGRADEGELALIRALLGEADLPDADLGHHEPTTVFVARHGGGIVGGAALEVHGEWGLLRSLVVAPSVRREGLGGQLIGAVLDEADRLDLQGVYLLTEGAEGFFGEHGFEIIGRSAVPAEVQASSEFAVLCPVTAVAMRR